MSKKECTLFSKDLRLPKIKVLLWDWKEPIHFMPGTRISKQIYYATLSSDIWYKFKSPYGYVCYGPSE